MRSDNIIQKKSYDFAVKIVKLYQNLVSVKKEYVLSKQLLRSGTSIGANVEEAIGGQSKKDFAAKVTISYKEARETHFWLRLLFDTGYIDKEQKEEYISDVNEILRIIGSILKTVKSNS
jgi:four helix bundle protein